jgi:hypothetical protein
LKPDYFTRGHTQWYYFSVANTRKDKVKFINIVDDERNIVSILSI